MYFPLSPHKTVFGIGHEYIVDAAARRQKWIDQSQSVNLFLAKADLKTTYYLRTLQASNVEKSTLNVKKEQRGVVATQTAATAATNAAKKEFTAAEKNACSIDAMLNGEECEACQ